MTRTTKILVGVTLSHARLHFGVRRRRARLKQLEQSLSDAQHSTSQETQRADDLAAQLNSQDADIARLEDELASAQEPDAPSSEAVETSAGGSPEAKRLGQPGRVGQMVITPTSFSIFSQGAGTTVYYAVVAVKNNFADDIAPFCGNSGAAVVDAKAGGSIQRA